MRSEAIRLSTSSDRVRTSSHSVCAAAAEASIAFASRAAAVGRGCSAVLAKFTGSEPAEYVGLTATSLVASTSLALEWSGRQRVPAKPFNSLPAATAEAFAVS